MAIKTTAVLAGAPERVPLRVGCRALARAFRVLLILIMTALLPAAALATNQPPTVSLSSPADGATFTEGSSVFLVASATDTDPGGRVTNVEFFQGTTFLGTGISPTPLPAFSFYWNNVPAGSYTLTAKATDNSGAVTTSAARTITVVANQPPTVSLTSPAPGQVLAAPTSVTLTAATADSDGTIAKVEFYQGTTLIGTATAAPYAFAWSNVPPGSYTLTATATDNQGVQSSSAPVAISVVANQPPTVTLTSPTANQGFTAPASVSLAASAADPDNNLVKVEFFQNGTLIASAFDAPYTALWSNVAASSYTLTATATDALGAQATSAPVTITVANAQAGVYYLYMDHLNTPRLVTDERNKIVWRNQPVTEPFGNSPVEEDPDGDGIPFTLNLRFPGQYFDRETNLHDNWHRTYDPLSGRYTTADPLGLAGGSLSLYTYADNAPLIKTDPLGLATYQCTRRLNNVPFRFGPLFHQYMCTGNAKTGYSCKGLGPTGSMFNSPGQLEPDPYKPERCEKVQDDNQCIEDCIQGQFKNGQIPNYSVDLSHGENCQTYANATVSYCVAKCSVRKK